MFRRNRPNLGPVGGDPAKPADLRTPVPVAEPTPPAAEPSDVTVASKGPSDKGIDMQFKTPTPGTSPTPGQPSLGLTPGGGLVSGSAGPMPATPAIPGAPSPGGGFRSDIPRRVVEIPGTPPRRVAPTGTEGNAPLPTNDMRKLIVGREISLSGEIAACDILVVEGTVEAKLREGRAIEVTDSGLFKGSVEIDEADIGGRFEGDISVRGTLRVRATGRIQGNIRYGVLEVEQGGLLVGTIETLGGDSRARPLKEVDGVVAAGTQE
ncbi:bactofilin family protein [Nitrospirillum iridis]|uniref:Cytoskeletal protein CcmA (Bactofilin family) n=1 Tax=Nitrospirillum iridis TaxID=765888 RepID=A0A7X0AYV9_9PROT|nr:polymer-forming cytoskeletal protein [Nitrospirillum iridis]MBB6252678.1 cytoskeletal protein CcmA (bactofilin family) [Nitrospirillum iridis]